MKPSALRCHRALTLLLALGPAIGSVVAQDVSRVLPHDLATVEGNSQAQYPFQQTSAARVMQAYGRSTLGVNHPVLIKAIRFRPDGGPAPGTFLWDPNFRLNMSTSRNPAQSLDPDFDSNHGADRRTVRPGGSQPFSLLPAVNSSPNPFVVSVAIDPFEWDPRSGPLLMDFQFFSSFGSFPVPMDAVAGSHDVGRIMALGNATAATATYNGGVTENIGMVVELVTEALATPVLSSSLNSPTIYPWGSPNPMRVQYAYGQDEIPFGGRHRIHALRWRVDPSSTFLGTTYDVSINMMTMPWPASTLQQNFSANFGSDRTVVFAGLFTAPAGDVLEIPLMTPFEYDRSNGTLVVDIALRNSPSYGGPLPHFEGAFQTENAYRAYHNSNPYATTTSAPVQQHGLRMEMIAERAPTLPQASDVTPGSHSVYPFNLQQPHRVMQLYKGSTFIAGPSPLNIQHLRWRPHHFGAGGTFGPATYTCTIDLARRYSSNGPLSHTFDNNQLIGKKRVFEGTFSVPYVESTHDPNDFPIAVKLDTPYEFRPIEIGPFNLVTHYDLVVDIRMLASSGSTASCDGPRNTADVWRVANYSDPNATVANYPSGSGPDHFALAMRTGGQDPNATSIAYGSGCPGSNGTPRCVTTNLPVLPSAAFTVKMLNGLPNGLSVLLLGLTQQSLPLTGMPGCNQLTGGELGGFAVINNSQGVATRQFQLPGAPGLTGFPFTTQWASLDPAANAVGSAVSDAQRHTARYR